MNNEVPRYLWHNGGWWVRQDQSPAVPCLRQMDQRLSTAVTRFLPEQNEAGAALQAKPPGRTGR